MSEGQVQVNKPSGRRWLRILIPVVVIALSVVLAMTLVKTAPSAKRAPAEKQARLVQVLTVAMAPAPVEIEAMGTVTPASSVALQPQVSGEVLEISANLLPGGLIRKGDGVLRIDDSDYRLAVQQKESEVVQAKSNLRIEQGQQLIARQELEMLGEDTQGEALDLLLRKPQLQSAEATIAMAEAALARARLDLQRTRILAPFNALVLTRDSTVGSRVNTTTRLATLVDSDVFWLEVAVAVDELTWIEMPDRKGNAGSRVRIYNEAAWGKGVFREGRVIRLAGDLDSAGRMAKLLVAIDDPLSLQADHVEWPALLINSYVRVVIEGRHIANAVSLPRELVRDNDQVWVMDADGTLRIRTVDIRFRGREKVLITEGLKSGEQLVITDLSAPVEGMSLRLAEEAEVAPVRAPTADTDTRVDHE